MKTIPMLIACSLCALTISARVARALTPHECNSYPFVRRAPVTHADLMREIRELEDVGYYPNHQEFDYPDDLQRAQAKLRAEYRRDCVAR